MPRRVDTQSLPAPKFLPNSSGITRSVSSRISLVRDSCQLLDFCVLVNTGGLNSIFRDNGNKMERRRKNTPHISPLLSELS